MSLSHKVTQEHDEAICGSCWTHTESFHAFYQSIKSAQNCYSSDEDDSNNAQHHQHHPQNVKLVMYDSVTGQVIEQRPNDHHYHIAYNTAENNVQQQHDVDGSTQMHVIEQEAYDVCEETTDSDLELMMMMQPHDTNNGIQQSQTGLHHTHHQQQQHQVLQHVEEVIHIGDEEDDDEDNKVGIIDGSAPNMAPILHIRDRSGGHSINDPDESVAEFLQNNERKPISFVLLACPVF